MLGLNQNNRSLTSYRKAIWPAMLSRKKIVYYPRRRKQAHRMILCKVLKAWTLLDQEQPEGMKYLARHWPVFHLPAMLKPCTYADLRHVPLCITKYFAAWRGKQYCSYASHYAYLTMHDYSGRCRGLDPRYGALRSHMSDRDKPARWTKL